MRHPGAFEIGIRTFLRSPEPTDESELLALHSRSRNHLLPWIHPMTNAHQFAAYLERAADPRVLACLVCRREDDAIAGVINISEIVRGLFQSAYLGYYCGTDYTGQGYMTEGMQLVLRHSFQTLRLHRVEANIQPANTASLRLVERCGFVKEGYSRRYLKIGGKWRDHERWALLSEDWRARRRPAV
ncbi:MAG: GNAT family N-acetyltransferase [Candidatus Eisenbacteria bacterium]|uniref:GNAT family N-acetyltransferase n=1 Tax=Eiseniibacteriota bacterium TaxID=2212470 RepID=A0A956M130_UNCEI|nr:GNAT family N-acetyltransferase [Candidatus Eisenbacteria bacterium]